MPASQRREQRTERAQHRQLAIPTPSRLQRPRHQCAMRREHRFFAPQPRHAQPQQAGRTPQPRDMDQLGPAQLGWEVPQQAWGDVFADADGRIKGWDAQRGHPASRKIGQARSTVCITGQHVDREPGSHLLKTQLVQGADRTAVAVRWVERRHDMEHAQWRCRWCRCGSVLQTRHRGPIPQVPGERKDLPRTRQECGSLALKIMLFL